MVTVWALEILTAIGILVIIRASRITLALQEQKAASPLTTPGEYSFTIIILNELHVL